MSADPSPMPDVRLWPTCRHRFSSIGGPWNPTYRCHRRALFGRCVEHHLARLRWEGRWGALYWDVDLSKVNRPHLGVDECRPVEYVALSWGNGNSDSVWTVGWQKRREP